MGCHSFIKDWWKSLQAASNSAMTKELEPETNLVILRTRTVSFSRVCTPNVQWTLMQQSSDSSQLRSIILQHSLRGVPLSIVLS